MTLLRTRPLRSPLLLALLLAACPKPAPVATPEPAPCAPPPAPPAPPALADLQERVGVLLERAQDGDQQQRLIALQDLLLAQYTQSPEAQQIVQRYAQQIADIENRNLPVALEAVLPLAIEPVAVEELPTIKPEEQIRQAMEAVDAGRYEEAIALLRGMQWPETVELRDKATESLLSGLSSRADRMRESRSVEDLQAAARLLEDAVQRFPDAPLTPKLQEQLDAIRAEIKVMGG